MTITRKIKKIIKERIKSSASLNIDSISFEPNLTVLIGWCSNSNAPINKSINVHKGQQLISSALFTFDREDVVKSNNLVSVDYCFGFIAVLRASKNDLKDLVLEHSNSKFKLSKQRYITVGNVNEIIAHAGNKIEEARKFISQQNINVDGDIFKGVRPIKSFDQDVEKIKNILQPININSEGFFNECTAEHIPEIHKIWKSKQKKSNSASVKVFGDIPSNPIVTIIVPLYGRYDFVQHQISHFSKDPDFANVELIYVLDDPRLKHELSVTAFGVFQIFDLPFKVIFSEHNLGFAGANNLGVSYACSENILLLNSDIIPSKSGWVHNLISQFDNIEYCGILGATLLYEDETIQHVGMEFRKDSSYPGIWLNHHPSKGIHIELTEQFDYRQVQLTTGACMLMKKSLYDKVGGFDPMYVLGDFEDSDLCLKCIKEGFNIYVSGKIKLYHLERLSQDLVDSGDWKFKLTMLNGVYQSSKWSSTIEELV